MMTFSWYRRSTDNTHNSDNYCHDDSAGNNETDTLLLSSQPPQRTQQQLIQVQQGDDNTSNVDAATSAGNSSSSSNSSSGIIRTFGGYGYGSTSPHQQQRPLTRIDEEGEGEGSSSSSSGSPPPTAPATESAARTTRPPPSSSVPSNVPLYARNVFVVVSAVCFWISIITVGIALLSSSSLSSSRWSTHPFFSGNDKHDTEKNDQQRDPSHDRDATNNNVKPGTTVATTATNNNNNHNKKKMPPAERGEHVLIEALLANHPTTTATTTTTTNGKHHHHHQQQQQQLDFDSLLFELQEGTRGPEEKYHHRHHHHRQEVKKKEEEEKEKNILINRLPYEFDPNSNYHDYHHLYSQLIYLDHTEAYDHLLLNHKPKISSYGRHYFLYNSGGFDVQINQAYCAVATVAGVLNSLRFLFGTDEIGIDIPVDSIYRPYNYATQLDLFGECTRENVIYHSGVDALFPSEDEDDSNNNNNNNNRTVDGNGNNNNNNNASDADDVLIRDGILVPPYGLGLAQVTALLECHLNTTTTTTTTTSSTLSTRRGRRRGRRSSSTSTSSNANSEEGNGWYIRTFYLDPNQITLDEMRIHMTTALRNPHARLLINYHRGTVGQVGGGGHFSPVGAYASDIDSFLVLDVAKYKYPPVWIPSHLLYRGLSTHDDCGVWDFPYGQKRLLDRAELMRPNGTEQYEEAKKVLGCEKRYRGFIIIEKKE